MTLLLIHIRASHHTPLSFCMLSCSEDDETPGPPQGYTVVLEVASVSGTFGPLRRSVKCVISESIECVVSSSSSGVMSRYRCSMGRPEARWGSWTFCAMHCRVPGRPVSFAHARQYMAQRHVNKDTHGCRRPKPSKLDRRRGQ